MDVRVRKSLPNDNLFRERSWMDTKTTEWDVHGGKAIHVMCKHHPTFNYREKCTLQWTDISYLVNSIVKDGKKCNGVFPNMKHKRHPISPI